MQLSNYHSHCTFCDGRSTPEDFIKFAVAHGFRAYGFSSHSPLPFETFWNMSKDDMPEYLTEIERLKKKYSDRLEIYVGLEIDFLDESYNASIPYFRNLPLDYRIGSIHFLPIAQPLAEENMVCIDGPGVPEVCRRLLRRRYPQAGRPLFQFHTANDRGRRNRHCRAHGQDIHERAQMRRLRPASGLVSKTIQRLSAPDRRKGTDGRSQHEKPREETGGLPAYRLSAPLT